jgi:thiol-disulfide isomerase/thioredoxin
MKSAAFKVLALTCLLAASLGTARASLKVGDPLPDLAACQLAGQLPDLLAGKVVLLDFWASWCDSCADSLLILDDLQKKYGSASLVIIAVNVDDSQADMEKFLKLHPVSIATVRDARQILGDKVNVSVMPTAILFGRDGKAAYLHGSFHGSDTRAAYEQEISILLKH